MLLSRVVRDLACHKRLRNPVAVPMTNIVVCEQPMKKSTLVACIATALMVFLLAGCATGNIRSAQVNIRPDVAANLPKDQALTFLRTLYVPETANSCRFEKDGVSIWWKGKVAGKNPYKSTYLSLQAVKGIPQFIILSTRGSNEYWCYIFPYPIAKEQGKETPKLTDKIFTALLSLGAAIIPESELAKGLRCRAELEWCQPARSS